MVELASILATTTTPTYTVPDWISNFDTTPITETVLAIGAKFGPVMGVVAAISGGIGLLAAWVSKTIRMGKRG